ncbi:MAG: hypothetical protein M3443_16155, partial [Actinomycetota bacterium]|nr:hypothetical protein [Actinomycetota bacterium]
MPTAEGGAMNDQRGTNRDHQGEVTDQFLVDGVAPPVIGDSGDDGADTAVIYDREPPTRPIPAMPQGQ